MTPGTTQGCFNVLLEIASKSTVDFEIKRFVIGLTSVIQTDPSQLSATVQPLFQQIFQTIVYLSQKSIEIEMGLTKKVKDMAKVDNKAETAIIEDEEGDDEILSDEEDDEDYNLHDDEDQNDLYDSKLDPIHEVIFFRDALIQIQSSNQQVYNYLMQSID